MGFCLRNVFLPVALSLATTALAEPVWVPFGGNEYALTEIGGTWTECEAEALAHDAHLVAVNSAAENSWVVDQFGVLPHWIGLHETDNDGIYVWANGDTLGFEAWAPGQPDWLTWNHDYVSINLSGSIGLWHNSHDTGYPNGTPNTGIMERSRVTPAVGLSPVTPALRQNSPNPFNPRTTIAFDLPRRSVVSLRVYDVYGRLVDVLLDGEITAEGHNEVVWHGGDAAGRAMPSGTYFYCLEAGGSTETRRMMLIR